LLLDGRPSVPKDIQILALAAALPAATLMTQGRRELQRPQFTSLKNIRPALAAAGAELFHYRVLVFKLSNNGVSGNARLI
jgi:hypothetical protein